MLSSTSLYFWNPKACIFDNTYKVVHGEWNIIQDLNQKLLSNQGSDVSVPVGQPLTAKDGRMQKRKRKRTVHAYKVFGPHDMLYTAISTRAIHKHIVNTAINSAFIRARDVKKLDATPVLCPYWSPIKRVSSLNSCKRASPPPADSSEIHNRTQHITGGSYCASDLQKRYTEILVELDFNSPE